MFARNLLILGSTLVLSGCLSYEGLYTPDCIAHAGSEIWLGDGRYKWTKFTDQVSIDADGNPVDPFPGFPREGKYAKNGKRIMLDGAGDIPPATMALVADEGSVYLYTAAEMTAFEATGQRPPCPLELQRLRPTE